MLFSALCVCAYAQEDVSYEVEVVTIDVCSDIDADVAQDNGDADASSETADTSNDSNDVAQDNSVSDADASAE